jgi:GntR family transcriptional regulator
MLSRDSSVPLYVQIKEYIRQNILSGVYPPDSRIPSERQLAEQFGVSRLTVKNALDELAQEGLLHTRVGKGTFVSASKINQELHTLSSFTEEMLRRGQHPSSRVLSTGIMAADEEVARALQIEPGTKVVVMKRVRLADNQPVALETTTLVAALCPAILEKHDFSCESLYRVLSEEYGLRMVHAQQTIEARHATHHEVEALKIEPHIPILGITRVTYNEQDQPVEYARSAYRGDRYKFNAILRRVGSMAVVGIGV